MTDPQSTPPRRRRADRRASAATTTSRRRSHPAASSRILVTGLSVAATLGLATSMATPEVPDPRPVAAQAPTSEIAVPSPITIAATDQPAATTSHAS